MTSVAVRRNSVLTRTTNLSFKTAQFGESAGPNWFVTVCIKLIDRRVCEQRLVLPLLHKMYLIYIHSVFAC